MNLIELLHAELHHEFGDTLLWEDYIRGSAKLTPENALLRAGDVLIRDMVGKYIQGTYADFEPLNGGLSNSAGYTTYQGVRGGTLFDVLLLNEAIYAIMANPKNMHHAAIPALAKAEALGMRHVVLCVLNQNNQEWAWFKLEATEKGYGQYLESRQGSEDPGKIPEYKIEDASEIGREVDKYLEKIPAEPESRWARKVLHPSELSTSECDRALAYGLLGTEPREKIPALLRRVFDTGHVYHNLVQTLFKNKTKDFHPEVKVKYRDLRIEGHCDGVFNYAARDGIEIKTISYNGFIKLTKVKPEHEKQATIYGVCLDLEKVHYLYVSKNTGELKQYSTEIRKDAWHMMATRAGRITAAVDDGELPTPINKPYVCKSCKYEWICKPNTPIKGFRR
jgi:hypothetical protein